jgi:hypothetical protein
MSFSLLTNTDDDAFAITLAASATTDGCDITITGRKAGVQNFEFWISEAATGAGLTADTYSGTVTVATGTQLAALTAKKHLLVQTDATGVAVITAVASANPTDQYFCVNAGNGTPIVSAVSGTNWEGA